MESWTSSGGDKIVSKINFTFLGTILVLTLFVGLSLVSAVYNNENLPGLKSQAASTVSSINNATLNVNNSNFLGGLPPSSYVQYSSSGIDFGDNNITTTGNLSGSFLFGDGSNIINILSSLTANDTYVKKEGDTMTNTLKINPPNDGSDLATIPALKIRDNMMCNDVKLIEFSSDTLDCSDDNGEGTKIKPSISWSSMSAQQKDFSADFDYNLAFSFNPTMNDGSLGYEKSYQYYPIRARDFYATGQLMSRWNSTADSLINSDIITVGSWSNVHPQAKLMYSGDTNTFMLRRDYYVSDGEGGYVETTDYVNLKANNITSMDTINSNRIVSNNFCNSTGSCDSALWGGSSTAIDTTNISYINNTETFTGSKSFNGITTMYNNLSINTSGRYLKIYGTGATGIPTLESSTYIYMMPQNTLTAYFTSAGLNYMDGKGMNLGASVEGKNNEIFGTYGVQRNTTGSNLEGGYLGTADVDKSASYSASNSWLLGTASNRSCNRGINQQKDPSLLFLPNGCENNVYGSISHNNNSFNIWTSKGYVNLSRTNIEGNLTVNGLVGIGTTPSSISFVKIGGTTPSTVTSALEVTPTIPTTSGSLYGGYFAPTFSGLPTAARSIYGLNFQSNLKAGDGGYSQIQYGGYFTSGIQAVPATTFTANNVLVGIMGTTGAQTFGGTIPGNVTHIGGFFPEISTSVGGTGTKTTSLAMGGHSIIASNKRLYLEGTVGDVTTSPGFTYGDSFIIYNTTAVEIYDDNIRTARFDNGTVNVTVNMNVGGNYSSNGKAGKTTSQLVVTSVDFLGSVTTSCTMNFTGGILTTDSTC